MPNVKQQKDLVFFLLEGGWQVEEKDDVFVITYPLELVEGAPPFSLQIVVASTEDELRFVADLCRKDQIRADEPEWMPPPDDRLQDGDVLLVTGRRRPASTEELEEAILREIAE
jgi:hypothetical protein